MYCSATLLSMHRYVSMYACIVLQPYCRCPCRYVYMPCSLTSSPYTCMYVCMPCSAALFSMSMYVYIYLCMHCSAALLSMPMYVYMPCSLASCPCACMHAFILVHPCMYVSLLIWLHIHAHVCMYCNATLLSMHRYVSMYACIVVQPYRRCPCRYIL